MSPTLLDKKIPALFGWLFLLAGLAGAFLLIKKRNLLSFKKEAFSPPLKIHIANVDNQSAAVSWLTPEPTSGFLQYGPTPALEKKAVDDRDQQSGQISQLKTHYVSLKNLSPETTYYFKIGAGSSQDQNKLYDNQGQPYSFSTGKSLSLPQETKTLKGKILQSNQSPAAGALVYLTSAQIAPLSTLTDGKGYWTILLHQARSPDLSNYASFSLAETVFRIEAQNGEEETSASFLAENAFPLLPELILGHQPYHLEINEGQRAEQMVTSPERDPESKTVVIENPAENGEEINTNQPQFRGQGPPLKVLTIKVESSLPYTTAVTVDDQGNWQFSLPFPLSNGEHSLTISYLNQQQEEETVSRNFTVLAAGESQLPAITATPSGSISPSPLSSPFASPSPLGPQIENSPSPNLPTPAPVEGQNVPVTGNTIQTIALFLAGLLMFSLGLGWPIRI